MKSMKMVWKEENVLEASLNSLCYSDIVGITEASAPWSSSLYRQCFKCNKYVEPKEDLTASVTCSCPDEELASVIESSFKDVPKKKFTRHQWLALIVCILAQFGCAVCVSLQAPFFPDEAEKKGFKSSVYGFVFGAFSLTVFLIAPIFGKYVTVLGVQFTLNSGIFVTGTCCILFGLLDKCSPKAFIGLAFAVRIVEAIGEAAYSTACFTLIAQEFPNNIGTAFSIIRAAFGAGLIAGPTIGGLLYHIGGYYFPFAVMGSILLSIALATRIIFFARTDMVSQSRRPSIIKAIRIPSVLLCTVATSAAAISVGFLAVGLERDLEKLGMNKVQVGLMFGISGGVFALTSVIWGWLCEKKVHPKILTTVGFMLVCVTYLLLAPPPFMPFKPKIWICIVALVIHGLGIGGELMPPYVDALRESVRHGFPDDMDTYGMIGGLWSGTTQLGNFIGPTVGGIIIQHIGFAWATAVLFAYHGTMGTITLIFYLGNRYCKNKDDIKSSDAKYDEKTPLLAD